MSRPAAPTERPASAGKDLVLRTTITGNSVQRNFGIPGAVDYRSHPGQRDADPPSVVFQAMKGKELVPLQDIKFLKGTIYSYKNRKVITRWLRDVSAAFALKSTTLALAVQITDAYIIRSLETLAVQRCQLAAISALWVAAKFEEMDEALPKLRQIVDVCDGAYTKEDVVCMEEDILDLFKWRIPHTTVINHLYLFLHMHGLIPPCVSSPTTATPPSASASASDMVAVELVVVDPESKQRVSLHSAIPVTATFQQSLPQLCQAVRIPFSSAIEVFELMGTDFLVAKRVPLSETPAERRTAQLMHRPPRPQSASSSSVPQHPAQTPLRLYVVNSRQSTPVFAESNDVIVLKTVNGLLIHCALELLAPEAITHVEFLRLPSHVVALGVLALARCMVGTNMDETRTAITTIIKLLDISGSQALAAADLLCEKYQEAIAQPQGLALPLVRLPPDVRDRLKYVFCKQTTAA